MLAPVRGLPPLPPSPRERAATAPGSVPVQSVRLTQCAWWRALILSRRQSPSEKCWAHTPNFRGHGFTGPTLTEHETLLGFSSFVSSIPLSCSPADSHIPKPAIQGCFRSNPRSICWKPPMRCMRNTSYFESLFKGSVLSPRPLVTHHESLVWSMVQHTLYAELAYG